tara:strand:+ start:2048 stop:2251 length:204 start_codon:yes stop_codon:yes gene_type:complete
VKIKPSEQCKAAGLKGLKHLAEIVQESEQTLNNWSKNRPDLFEVIILGAVVKRATDAAQARKHFFKA